MSRIDETRDFIPVRIAILTVSDTRKLAEDRSGQVLVDRIAAAGHVLADRKIITDERDQIADQLRAWVQDPAIDVILTTGGTGLTGRDIAPEALTPLFDKKIEGFGELFRAASVTDIGAATIQSRAFAGLANLSQ